MLNFLSKCAHVTQMLSHVPRKAGWVGVSSFLCGTSDSRLLQQVREKKGGGGRWRGLAKTRGGQLYCSELPAVQWVALCGQRKLAQRGAFVVPR